MIQGLLLSIGIFYIGGWYIIWSDPDSGYKLFNIFSTGFTFSVNEEGYGLAFTDRFFDSIFLSWLLFGVGLYGMEESIDRMNDAL